MFFDDFDDEDEPNSKHTLDGNDDELYGSDSENRSESPSLDEKTSTLTELGSDTPSALPTPHYSSTPVASIASGTKTSTPPSASSLPIFFGPGPVAPEQEEKTPTAHSYFTSYFTSLHHTQTPRYFNDPRRDQQSVNEGISTSPSASGSLPLSVSLTGKH